MALSGKTFFILREEIDRSYTKAMLDKGFLPLAADFVQHNKALYLNAERDMTDVLELVNVFFTKLKLTKVDAVLVCASVFYSKDIFLAFRDKLPKTVRVILDELTWEPELHSFEIIEKFGIDILAERSTHWVDKNNVLKNEFYVFTVSHEYTGRWSDSGSDYNTKVYFPSLVRQTIKGYYPRPAKADFFPVDDTKEANYIFEAEKLITTELPRLIMFRDQGLMKTSNSGKLMASSVNKLAKSLKITEFYPENKSLGRIRSHLIASLLTSIGIIPKNKAVNVTLKNIFDQYLDNFHQSLHLLTELKGAHNVYWYEKKVGNNFLNLLKELPVNRWVSMNNLEDFIKYNFYDLEALRKENAINNLYYSVKYDYYSDKIYIDSANYKPLVSKAIIKGSLFLFAAFGLIDIAYNKPDTSEFGYTYHSNYDGIKYIRLTNLGAFISEKTTFYTPPKVDEEYEIKLSEDSLMILCKGEIPENFMIDTFADRISASRYRVTFQSFMKDCRNVFDVSNKIDLFKQVTSTDLPPIWKEFFREIDQKSKPFEEIEEPRVLKIDRNNKELIQLIAQDDALKKMVIKAEGFHLIIQKKDFSKFKSKLKSYGYIME
ncbi:hypothetical protein [Chondrinema litorale]|uniref:hypothetical protein n=1 Tax=Chondrinema litorale TaxID=2994555 RepID=UPI002543522D|nr:hypothetical protein [Chondrinema litorale]UZR97113.1 hypothetical protein OQ292_23735 [Chondrinema litorale]